MNKKLLLIMILSASLLAGCSSKNTANTQESSNTTNSTSKENSSIETTNKNSEEKNSEEKTTEEDTEQKEETKVLTRETLKKLVSESDYISRVKFTISADKTVESTILQDFKGDLSHIDIVLPKDLSPNTEYLVFLQDGKNGKITNTSVENSYLEIKDENVKNLQYIQSIFETKKSTSKETKKSSTENKKFENTKNSNEKESNSKEK